MRACVCSHWRLTAGETVEGQRAGSWPPASVTSVKVVVAERGSGSRESKTRRRKSLSACVQAFV